MYEIIRYHIAIILNLSKVEFNLTDLDAYVTPVHHDELLCKSTK